MAAAVGLACYRAPARTQPLAGALVAATSRSVAQATEAALAALSDDGIAIEQFRPDTGLVESAWFDVALLERAAIDYPAEERVVRFRFLAVADSAAGRTRIYLETLERFSIDPLGGRRRQRLVPGDHPAMELARRLLERTTSRLRP